jgi:hypothetical protein
MAKRKRLKEPTLTRAQILACASKAQVDPRTIRKVLRGEEVRGMAGERAAEALSNIGREPK